MWFRINLISLVSSWMSSRHLSLIWAVLSQLLHPWRGKCDGRGVWFVGGGLFEPEGANWDMMFPPSKVDWKTMRWSICESIMFFKERRWLRWVLSSTLMVGDVSHKEASIFLYKENKESKCWEDSLFVHVASSGGSLNLLSGYWSFWKRDERQRKVGICDLDLVERLKV